MIDGYCSEIYTEHQEPTGVGLYNTVNNNIALRDVFVNSLQHNNNLSENLPANNSNSNNNINGSDNFESFTLKMFCSNQRNIAKIGWWCGDMCYIIVDHDSIQEYRTSYTHLASKNEKIKFLKQFINLHESSGSVGDKRKKFKYTIHTNMNGRVEICRKFFKYIFNVNNYMIRETLAYVKMVDILN